MPKITSFLLKNCKNYPALGALTLDPLQLRQGSGAPPNTSANYCNQNPTTGIYN